MIRPHITTLDLAGRLRNVANATWLGTPVIYGTDGSIAAAVLTSALTLSTAVANESVICIKTKGYAVVTAKTTNTVTMDSTAYTGLTAVSFSIGGIEAHCRVAYQDMLQHIQMGVEKSDGTVVAQGLAAVTGDYASDWTAQIDDADTTFSNAHAHLSLAQFCRSQSMQGGKNFAELAGTFYGDYLKALRLAVMNFARKLVAAGTIESLHDRSEITAIMVERV